MNLKNIALLLLLLTLSGCASCPVSTFYKVTSVNAVDKVQAYSDGPLHTIFKIEPNVSINIHRCWTNGLCMKVSLPDGVPMQFLTNEFLELEIGGENIIQAHHVDKISYVVTCEEKKTMPRTCISSEESPTTSAVEILDTGNSSHDDWIWELYMKAFDATQEFTGASEIKGSLSLPLFSSKGQREYKLVIFMDHDDSTKDSIIRFPMVMIDGRSHKLPDIRLTEVSEPLCTYRPW